MNTTQASSNKCYIHIVSSSPPVFGLTYNLPINKVNCIRYNVVWIDFIPQSMGKPTTAFQMSGQRKALHPVTVGFANHTLLLAKDDMERLIDDSGAPIRTLTGRLWMSCSSFAMSPSANGLRKSGRVWLSLWSPRGRYIGHTLRDHDELEPERLGAQAHQDGARRCGSASGGYRPGTPARGQRHGGGLQASGLAGGG